MKFSVSTWSIRNPTPVILLFALLTLAGLLAFSTINIQNFPDIEPAIVTVSAGLPGASPAQIETDVARKIESALATVQGVKHIQSTLTDGFANISVEFRLEKPIQEALDDVRDAVARVRSDLPAALRDPVVQKVQFAGGPVLTYTVASSRIDTEGLSWFIDNELSKTLLAVPGVGSVTRVGGVSREARIELDPARLFALNATAAEISRTLGEVQQDNAGGRVDFAGSEHSVRTIGTLQKVSELAALEIALSDGRSVRLDQLATVADTFAEPRSAALLNGKPVVGFEIMRARGASEIAVMEGVRAALEELKQKHAAITFSEALNFVDPVIENYNGSMWLLYEGAALAVLVVFLFLRNGRATFVSAVALPMSVIPTFAVIYLMGFTLNTITLLSLSLVIGVLVDDAIVEVENIERHLLMGKTPYAAAMEAADEIGLAVIATTFTLVAVFLPTAFMSGMIGKFFVQFGWTAAIAVLFSLLVARLLTPMMAAYLLRVPKHPVEPRWMPLYLKWIRACLKHRLVTLIVVAGFFIGGLFLATTLPGGFMPPDDDTQTQVTLRLPPGSTLNDTLAIAEQGRRLVQKHPHVKQVYTAIGGGSNSSGPSDESASATNVRTAVLSITVTPRSARPGLTKQDIETQLRITLTDLAGVRVNVGESGEGYVVVLASDDSRALVAHAQQVERELRTIADVGAVTSSASLLQPELTIRPDFARAANLGVTSADIAETLRITTTGDYDQDLAKLNFTERQIPVRVRLSNAVREDLATLKQLPVPGTRGAVPLGNVASLEIASGPVEITRRDRMRNINIEVELNGQELSVIEQAALALPSLKNLPPSVSLSASGDAEAMGELVAGFGIAMLTGVLCIYLVLAVLLKDFVQPFTILVALVLSVPGAIIALFLTNSALSMPSMIGLIMLMGIATKNSILLIDYIVIARRDHGLNRWDAIIDACRKRARPIIMTTIAMGAGMLPIALGWGADPSFRAPMAIVVIGGLITSTLLSLLVIPLVYSYVDDAVHWIARRFGRKPSQMPTSV